MLSLWEKSPFRAKRGIFYTDTYCVAVKAKCFFLWARITKLYYSSLSCCSMQKSTLSPQLVMTGAGITAAGFPLKYSSQGSTGMDFPVLLWVEIQSGRGVIENERKAGASSAVSYISKHSLIDCSSAEHFTDDRHRRLRAADMKTRTGVRGRGWNHYFKSNSDFNTIRL